MVEGADDQLLRGGPDVLDLADLQMIEVQGGGCGGERPEASCQLDRLCCEIWQQELGPLGVEDRDEMVIRPDCCHVVKRPKGNNMVHYQ